MNRDTALRGEAQSQADDGASGGRIAAVEPDAPRPARREPIGEPTHGIFARRDVEAHDPVARDDAPVADEDDGRRASVVADRKPVARDLMSRARARSGRASMSMESFITKKKASRRATRSNIPKKSRLRPWPSSGGTLSCGAAPCGPPFCEQPSCVPPSFSS